MLLNSGKIGKRIFLYALVRASYNLGSEGLRSTGVTLKKTSIVAVAPVKTPAGQQMVRAVQARDSDEEILKEPFFFSVKRQHTNWSESHSDKYVTSNISRGNIKFKPVDRSIDICIYIFIAPRVKTFF